MLPLLPVGDIIIIKWLESTVPFTFFLRPTGLGILGKDEESLLGCVVLVSCSLSFFFYLFNPNPFLTKLFPCQ